MMLLVFMLLTDYSLYVALAWCPLAWFRGCGSDEHQPENPKKAMGSEF